MATVLVAQAASLAPAGVTFKPLEEMVPEAYGLDSPEEASGDVVALEAAVKRFRQQDYPGCWGLLTEAVQQNPQLPPPRLMLARFFLLHDLTPPGQLALEQAAAESPDYPGVYVSFGELALRQRRITDAKLHFEKALALVDSGKWPEDLRLGFLVRARSGAAAVAEARRDWDAAKSLLTEVLAVNPANLPARRRLAAVLLALDREKDALAELQRVREADADADPPAVALGWLYARAGQDEKATEWFGLAAEQAPDDARAPLAFATWRLQQGDLDGAQQHAEAAAQRDPDSPQAKMLRGVIARYRKDYAAAERAFAAIDAPDASALHASNQLALVLAEQDSQAKREKALRLAEGNCQTHPQWAEAQATLGWVCYRLGRLERAEQALQQAKTAGAGGPDLAYYLARVMTDRGQGQQARPLLERTLAGSAHFVYREEAQRLYDELAGEAPK